MAQSKDPSLEGLPLGADHTAIVAACAKATAVATLAGHRFDRACERFDAASETFARASKAQWAKHREVSEAMGDMGAALVRIERAIGVPPDPDAMRKSLSEARTPEDAEKAAKGSGILAEIARLKVSDRAQWRRILGPVAVGAFAGGMVQTLLVVALYLLTRR